MERRIRLIRDMLQRTGEAISAPQSPLMWETTFARISNVLNDHPIGKSNQTNLSSDTFDIITPNRLILGRNNRRGLSSEGLDFEASANLQKVLSRSHEIFQVWFKIYMENIHLLNMASTLKWTKSGPLPVIGDVVLSLPLSPWEDPRRMECGDWDEYWPSRTEGSRLNRCSRRAQRQFSRETPVMSL